jgi:hypothetical protein
VFIIDPASNDGLLVNAHGNGDLEFGSTPSEQFLPFDVLREDFIGKATLGEVIGTITFG